MQFQWKKRFFTGVGMIMCAGSQMFSWFSLGVKLPAIAVLTIFEEGWDINLLGCTALLFSPVLIPLSIAGMLLFSIPQILHALFVNHRDIFLGGGAEVFGIDCSWE